MNERAAANGRQSGIRVALVITGLEAGGAERCLTNIACGLQAEGFQTDIYSLRPPPAPPRDALLRRLESARVPVHFLDLRTQLQLFNAIRSLQTNFAATKPDLVQSFLFHANVVGTIAASRCGVRAICTGMRVAERGAWRWWLLRRIKHLVARHVCVSQSVADMAERRLGVRDSRLVVIPNGTDVARFHDARAADLTRFGVAPDRRVIVTVGRLERQKGVDRLLQLMPRAFAELPNHDLLIVGDGSNRKTLTRLAASEGIADRVHFAGWRDNVPAILRASELFVVASRWEGMSNALLEAMASGLPVVATDVEGVAELLGDGGRQQVVPVGDSEAFVRQIVQWGKNPQSAKETGEQNSQMVAEHFSLDGMIRQYKELYGELVGI